MKNLRYFVLAFVALLSIQPVLGQDTYGSACITGRNVLILERKYVMEYIAPSKWIENKEYSRSIEANNFMYPYQDSIHHETNISVKILAKAPSEQSFDVTIEKANHQYQSLAKEPAQQLSLHKSVTTAKNFVFKNPDTQMVESVTYIEIGDRLLSFTLKASNQKSFNKYVGGYTELLSSIRMSQLQK